MKKKLIALLAALTLLCSAGAGMAFTASAAEERGFGMSLAEWQDDYGQGKENADGSISIGADAHLKTPVYAESVTLDCEFTVLPAVDFWYVLALADTPAFNAQTVHTGTDTGAFAIMLQPGAESMSFNVFHWKDNGTGAFVREDIALGPLSMEGGLDMTEPFTVEIGLFGENPFVKVTQGSNVCEYNGETHVALKNVTKDQICDGYGRTYLNIASYAADGALKELTFSAIETYGGIEDVRNWSGEGISATDGKIALTQSASYLRAIDMSSKYLKLTMNVNMIIGNVDAWAAIAFGKTSALPMNNAAGLNIMMRNQAGKIAIQPELNAFGGAEAQLKSTDISLGRFVLELEETDGKMTVKINREVIEHPVFDTLTFADFTDENGYGYFAFGSYVQGDNSTNSVDIVDITTDLKAKEQIYIEVSNVPQSGMAGNAITLPEATVVQADGEQITATVAVTGPDSQPVTLTDLSFTPEAAGTYTVVYSAEDSKGQRAENSFTITVIDPDDALSMDSLKDMSNWNAPYGGVAPVEGGVQIYAHSYYSLPLSMDEGALRVSFNIDGLWDGNDADEATSTDAWICVGFVQKPAISAPGGFSVNGVYVRLNNRDGKLRVSVHYFSPLGATDIAIEDTFASSFDASGPATVELQPNGEGGIRLFVNGKEMRHDGLKNIYYSDVVDGNNCTYLAFSAYDNDDADIKLPNTQTRCFTLTGLSHEKTEIVEDVTPPTLSVANMPTTGTVGEKVILPPATITDDTDSSLTEQITVTGPDGKAVSVVNRAFTPQSAGEYTVTYNVSDSSGNAATPFTFKVTVAEAAKKGGGCSSSVGAAGIGVSALVLGLAAAVLAGKKKKDN